MTKNEKLQTLKKELVYWLNEYTAEKSKGTPWRHCYRFSCYATAAVLMFENLEPKLFEQAENIWKEYEEKFYK